MNSKSAKWRRILVMVVLGILGALLFFLARPYLAFSRATFPGAAFSLLPALPKNTEPLTREELVYLVKPSVVRIAQHVSGDVTVPAFEIDFEKRTVKFLASRKPFKTKIDEHLLGSGFIVTPEGHILTNAHVISEETIKQAVVGQLAVPAILFGSLKASEDVRKEFEKDEAQAYAFGRQIVKDIIAKSTFALKKEIFVIDPKSSGESLTKALEHSFPAEVILVNENFFSDDRDVGVIKISGNSLPAIRVGETSRLSIGNRIGVFGFPVTATLGGTDLVESSFTQGIISAIKDSENKAFKIYQTDSKVSQGSSGGPVLADDGEVVGLITFQTGGQAQLSGDNFAFAIPIEIARDALSLAKITNNTSGYYDHLKNGLELLKNKKCKSAVAEFELAKSVNTTFVNIRPIDSYIAECQNLIASGLSLDTSWSELEARVFLVPAFTWILLVGILVLLVVLLLVIFLFRKRIRHDEETMQRVEAKLNGNPPLKSTEVPIIAPVITPKKTPPVALGQMHGTTTEKQKQPEGDIMFIGEPVITPTALSRAAVKMGGELGVKPAEVSAAQTTMVKKRSSKTTVSIKPEAKSLGIQKILATKKTNLVEPKTNIEFNKPIVSLEPKMVKVATTESFSTTRASTITSVASGVENPVDPALTQYIKDAKEFGLSDNAIREELKKVGWEAKIIEIAVKA